MERIGEEAFAGPRLRRRGTWAVAFLADWCPFSRAFRSAFESLPFSPTAGLVADLTDPESPLWERFGIEVVPTVIVFRDGQPGPRFDGVPGEGLDGSALSAIATAIHPGGRSKPGSHHSGSPSGSEG